MITHQIYRLTLILNARHDTALYYLTPAKTGKKDRPKVRDGKLSFDDFTFSHVDGTDYAVGSPQVFTDLLGKMPVHAKVTKTDLSICQVFLKYASKNRAPTVCECPVPYLNDIGLANTHKLSLSRPYFIKYHYLLFFFSSRSFSRARKSTFPLDVRGSSSTNSTSSGIM